MKQIKRLRLLNILCCDSIKGTIAIFPSKSKTVFHASKMLDFRIFKRVKLKINSHFWTVLVWGSSSKVWWEDDHGSVLSALCCNYYYRLTNRPGRLLPFWTTFLSGHYHPYNNKLFANNHTMLNYLVSVCKYKCMFHMVSIACTQLSAKICR